MKGAIIKGLTRYYLRNRAKPSIYLGIVIVGIVSEMLDVDERWLAKRHDKALQTLGRARLLMRVLKQKVLE